MTLIRWEPSTRLFASLFDTPTADYRKWVPAVDVVENEDHYLLKADLPGLSEDDVSIEVEDRVLRLSGQRKAEHETKQEGYYRLERATGTFSRSLRLPAGLDATAIEATFDNGVLEVRIPKPEEAKPHRVSIAAKAAS
jgi:HSP20 family protein